MNDSSIPFNNDSAGSNVSSEEIIQMKTSKEIRNLNLFFSTNNFTVEKGDQKCNIINPTRPPYCVPNSHVEEFFDLLDQCQRQKLILHYGERQTTANMTHSGIMLDFDKYQDTKEVQVDELNFNKLIDEIGRILTDSLDFSSKELYDDKGRFKFHIFIIRRPEIKMIKQNVLNTVTYKDGFHILIPEIQVSKGFKIFLNERLASVMKKVFGRVSVEPEKMLDMNSSRVPVMFFGNCKKAGVVYNLQYVYTITVEENAGYDRGTAVVAEILNRPNVNLCYELSLGFYMQSFKGQPTWLHKRPFNYNVSLETQIQGLVEKKSNDIIASDELITVDKSLSILTMSDPEAKYLKQLLEIIDISYATDYDKWFRVICAIANTSNRYKDLAVFFSHRVPEQWSEGEIDRIWNMATMSTRKENIATRRSIIHWARISSVERFKEINKLHYGQKLRNFVYMNEGRVEHDKVAQILFDMIGDKFLADAPDGDKQYKWYEFMLPGQAMKTGQVFKWRLEGDPDNIHLYMSDHLSKVYQEIIDEIKQKKDEAVDEPRIKYFFTIEKTFRMYMSRLSENSFQNGTIRMAQFRFRSRGFLEELDSYPDVLGVGNGVLKLGHKSQLINWVHDYKVSKFTSTNYIPYDPNEFHIRELLRIYGEIYPEEDVREFMLFFHSTAVDAEESAGILLLTVGGGQNGKSFPLKMIHETLGHSFAGSGKIALLSGATERAESANSAQMQMCDKRFFYFEESNKCETLNSARVKTIASDSFQSGRDLHERQRNFKNTANPIAASNFDYIIDTTDHGTWRRLYYYRHKNKFCANPRLPNEFKENKAIIREFPKDPLYRQAMLSILVHYNERLRKEYNGDLKAIPVPTIAKETYDFRRRQDTIHRFIAENMVYSPKSDTIALSTVTTKYQEWYNINIQQMRMNAVEVNAQIEASCLANYIMMHANHTMLYIKEHRFANPSETLAEDERWYNHGLANLEKTILEAAIVDKPKVEVIPVVLLTDNIADTDNSNDLLQTLARGEQKFVQNSDHAVVTSTATDADIEGYIADIINNDVSIIK